ncbi:glpV [Symbiodinium sp. CCMP2456]|nr:glpV [Symbiodinium sp. CCMP2456]
MAAAFRRGLQHDAHLRAVAFLLWAHMVSGFRQARAEEHLRIRMQKFQSRKTRLVLRAGRVAEAQIQCKRRELQSEAFLRWRYCFQESSKAPSDGAEMAALSRTHRAYRQKVYRLVESGCRSELANWLQAWRLSVRFSKMMDEFSLQQQEMLLLVERSNMWILQLQEERREVEEQLLAALSQVNELQQALSLEARSKEWLTNSGSSRSI